MTEPRTYQRQVLCFNANYRNEMLTVKRRADYLFKIKTKEQVKGYKNEDRFRFDRMIQDENVKIRVRAAQMKTRLGS